MLTCHTNKTAKPPKGSRGKAASPRQLCLWGATPKPLNKNAAALEGQALRELAVLWTPAVQALDLGGVQDVEERCEALVDAVAASVARTYGRIKREGLKFPADVASYLVLRELDDKGRREVPEHRLKVIDFGVTAIVGGKK